MSACFRGLHTFLAMEHVAVGRESMAPRVLVSTAKPTEHPPPRPRHLAWLALAYVVFIVYGSLVPFRTEVLSQRRTLQRIDNVLTLPRGLESRSDFVANILLFVPFGFLLTASVSMDRGRRAAGWAAPWVVAAAALLSLLIELAQVYFPDRTPSITDVLADTAGAALGVLLWIWLGQRLLDSTHRLLRAHPPTPLAEVLAYYFCIVLLLHVAPLDLTLSPTDLRMKFDEGRVQLWPFEPPRSPNALDQWERILSPLLFLPAGAMLAWMGGTLWASWLSWPRILALGLAAVGLVECLQLFVYSRCCDVASVLLGGVAVLAGWAGGLALRRQRGSEPRPLETRPRMPA